MSSSLVSLVAFVSSEHDLAALKAFAAARGMLTERIYRGTVADAAEYLRANPSPDVLLVELPSQKEAPALLDQLAELCDPVTKVITIGTVNEYSFYCWLMDIGIAQYLLSPLEEQALAHAFDKLLSSAAMEKKDKPPSNLIAVMGARGGVGATTVALNIAAILAETTHKRVALVDLDPKEGSVALSLDMQPSIGLRDALEKPERIDALFLERVMSKVGKYLSVLSAEERLSDELHINEHAAHPLLEELKGRYDYVVLDVPRHMNHFTRTCLQKADHTLLVAELSLLCLRDTLRMQDAMREGWNAKPPFIVANRVGLAARQQVPVADFEKGAGVKIAGQIAFTPDIFMPISREIPSIRHKTHAAMKPLYQLASAIAPESKPAQAVKKPAFSFSFLGKKE